ncbi:MAG: ferrous iron transport protein A [Streptococcaceae bacterium]|jgi:ferrous iron transport protein A|nr:ferrous iron transport protein A [Streptococcaceae bacterium]
MISILNAQKNKSYSISSVDAPPDLKRHLQNIGIQKQAKVSLLTLSKDSGIITVSSVRIALDKSVLDLIKVEEINLEEAEWSTLTELKVGEKGKVLAVHGTSALKRRLMDMGITRGVEVEIKKTAPLGDPIEIHLRGYELTLRKSEGELVLVIPS